MPPDSIEIVPLAPLLDHSANRRSLDDIFFGSSRVQDFKDDQQRSAFHQRWLGRYLGPGCDTAHGFAAFHCQRAGGASGLVGYLVGALDNPALASRFADISLYQTFKSQCERFPAHLHINIASEFRNLGIGARLIGTFCTYAAAQGVGGAHVITAGISRNVSFYNRVGFKERGCAGEGADKAVFLGRILASE